MSGDQPEEVTRFVDAVDALMDIEDDAQCAQAITDALKHWGESSVKLREERQARVNRLKAGKTWQEVGELIGVHFTRAQQIGKGRSGASKEKDAREKKRAKEAGAEQSEK